MDAFLSDQEKILKFTILSNWYLSQFSVGINSKELLCLFIRKNLFVLYYILIEVLRIDLYRLIFFIFFRLEDILYLAHIIAALKGPAIRIFSRVINCNSSTSFLWHMVTFVFAVHVLLHEITALVLEIFTI